MPYDVDIGDGADALGQNQLTDALDGTYWVSGWDATLGTGDLEVDIAAGDGAVDGTDVSTGATQTIDFTGDPDGTDPRKAVIYVDATGTVQKSLGTPQPVDPTGEIRFRTYNPSPPASVSGVVVAEVWLEAGATELVSDDVRDRRVSNQAASDLGTFSLVAGGYVDETANRSVATQYTNNTGNPLQVFATLRSDTENSQFAPSLSVDGSKVDETTIRVASSNIRSFTDITLKAIVPDGSTYEASEFQSNAVVDRWNEQELKIE